MRWPLRNQILVRILSLVLLAILAVTVANIRSIESSNRQQETARLKQLGDLLASNPFPLTPGVLESVKLLSSADLVLVDQAGNVVSQTQGAPGSVSTTVNEQAERLELEEGAYYRRVVALRPSSSGPAGRRWINLYLPRQTEAAIWWQAGRTPLLIALALVPFAILISLAQANQVTRPLAMLGEQVDRLAAGEPCELPPSPHNDEIRDLSQTLHGMSAQIQSHQQQFRQQERLETLIQFGNSIAHHLRNSVTGCRMALELLEQQHPELTQQESLPVALRQLDLMDNYIRKFVMLSNPENAQVAGDPETVDLEEVVERVKFLLGPTAEHLQVDLQTNVQPADWQVFMVPEDAQQLVMNLVSNALEAASTGKPSSQHQANVSVTLSQPSPGRCQLVVADSGAGPPPEIAAKLFEPFVSGSREGTGLGLALVSEITDRLGGEVFWARRDGHTEFTVEFDCPRPQEG